LAADEATTLPYFLNLFPVKARGIDKIIMSPEEKKNRVIEALKKIVLKGSQIKPLIIAFEDLHWIDKNSEDVLQHLLEIIPGAAVFVICTYRPEFVYSWGAKSFYNHITLNPLSNTDSLEILNHFLGTEYLNANLKKSVLVKTDGIPLFIEEFGRSLKNLKIRGTKGNTYKLAETTDRVTIPSKIQRSYEASWLSWLYRRIPCGSLTNISSYKCGLKYQY